MGIDSMTYSLSTLVAVATQITQHVACCTAPVEPEHSHFEVIGLERGLLVTVPLIVESMVFLTETWIAVILFGSFKPQCHRWG